MDSKSSSMMLMAGGALLSIGSFMAWANEGEAPITGMDSGDGWYTLLAGVALLALGFMSYSGRAYPSWLAWVALAVGAAVALIRFFDIRGFGGLQIGIGMWIMLAGVVVAALGLAMGRKSA